MMVFKPKLFKLGLTWARKFLQKLTLFQHPVYITYSMHFYVQAQL